jgi:hypothetical protein
VRPALSCRSGKTMHRICRFRYADSERAPSSACAASACMRTVFPPLCPTARADFAFRPWLRQAHRSDARTIFCFVWQFVGRRNLGLYRRRRAGASACTVPAVRQRRNLACLVGKYSGKVVVDDINSDAAAAYFVANARASLEQKAHRWTLREFVRIGNLAGRSYAGSVIVNESNRRFFEPAPQRTYLAGVTLSFAW